MSSSYEFTTLHERPDLLEDAARMLISEWPRSLEARKASIQSSKNSLPCSLLLLANDRDCTGTKRVVGFARVLEVVGDSSAALIESVEPSLRGQGLGRKLMETCENHVIRLGMTSLHLSTHDKQTFYRHLGYTDGPAKTALRHSGKIQDSVVSLIASMENVRDEKVTPEASYSQESSINESSNQVAAPPAPPPPKISTVNNQDKTCTTWMVKHLHSNS